MESVPLKPRITPGFDLTGQSGVSGATLLTRRVLATVMLAWAAVVVPVYYGPGLLHVTDPGWWPQTRMLGDQRLPYFGEAMARNFRAVLGAVYVCGSAGGYGWLAARWLFPGRSLPGGLLPGDRLIVSATLGFGVVAYLCFSLSSAGLYRPWAIHTVVSAGWVVGLVAWWCWRTRQTHRTPPPPAAPPPRPEGDELEQIPPTSEARPSAGSSRDWGWVAMALLAGGMALVGALTPEVEFDAAWYHLGFLSTWLAHGGLVDNVDEVVSLYPMTWELVFGAAYVAGGPIAGKLIHFVCLPLTAVVIYRSVQRFVPGGSAWFAVAVFVTMPTVIWEATTAYVDLSLALLVAASFYGAMVYLTRRDDEKATAWRWLVFAALALGLALASKHLAMFAAVSLAAVVAGWQWRADRRVLSPLRPLVVLTLVSFLVALPWYVRAYRASGNPVFPGLYSVFGAEPEGRWDALADGGYKGYWGRFGHTGAIEPEDPRERGAINRRPERVWRLPWDVSIHPASYGGNLGPMLLILLPAAAVGWRPGRPVTWLALGAAGYAVFWASPVSSFQLRFLAPAWPLMAVVAADAAGRLTRSLAALHPRAPVIALAGGLAVLTLNLPFFTHWHQQGRGGTIRWITHVHHGLPLAVVVGGESADAFVARHVRSFRAWQHLNATIEPDARVLSFFGGDHLYAEREQVSSYAVSLRPAVWASDPHNPAESLATLARARVTHVLFNLRYPDMPAARATFVGRPETADAWFETVYEDDVAVAYRIRWELWAGE
jgi:hypothetical protein